MLDLQAPYARPARGARSLEQRSATFGERDDSGRIEKIDQLSEAPHAAAVERVAALTALTPARAQEGTVEPAEVALDLEETAATLASVRAASRLVPRAAGFLSALDEP